MVFDRFKGFIPRFKLPTIFAAPRKSPDQIKDRIKELRYKANDYKLKAWLNGKKSNASSNAWDRKNKLYEERKRENANYFRKSYDLEQLRRLSKNEGFQDV